MHGTPVRINASAVPWEIFGREQSGILWGWVPLLGVTRVLVLECLCLSLCLHLCPLLYSSLSLSLFFLKWHMVNNQIQMSQSCDPVIFLIFEKRFPIPRNVMWNIKWGANVRGHLRLIYFHCSITIHNTQYNQTHKMPWWAMYYPWQ